MCVKHPRRCCGAAGRGSRAASLLQAASVPVVFDEHHLSEVQNMASEEKLDQVVDSMKESKVALIGKDSACPPRRGSGFA